MTMKKNEKILQLAEEITIDITDSRIPLHNVMLKAARLSLLLDLPDNVKWFKDHAKNAEQQSFLATSFQSSILAAQDKDISISSANPNQYIISPAGNFIERGKIRDEAKTTVGSLAHYRAETFNFALNIFHKWQFGNLAEGIFEKKRNRTDVILREIFPDSQHVLNSIEQNIHSDNPEDWKNAVVSCRTLLMNIADILNPASTAEEKQRYINRLKDFVSPLTDSGTQGKLIKSHLDELKKRVEYTSDITQGSAHKETPALIEAENIVLYTYLLISDLLELYAEKLSKKDAAG